jgi:hypothetical protein
MRVSLTFGAARKKPPPRAAYYAVVRSHQAVETAGFPLTQERKAGPIAHVPMLAIDPKQLKQKVIPPTDGEKLFEYSKGAANRDSEGRQEGTKEARTAAFCRQLPTVEKPLAIFQTVSEGGFTEVRHGTLWFSER